MNASSRGLPARGLVPPCVEFVSLDFSVFLVSNFNSKNELETARNKSDDSRRT
jgi:hypothetical protein